MIFKWKIIFHFGCQRAKGNSETYVGRPIQLCPHVCMLVLATSSFLAETFRLIYMLNSDCDHITVVFWLELLEEFLSQAEKNSK